MKRRLRSGMSRVIRPVNPTGDFLFVAILVQLLALGLLDPSFSKAVLADEDTAGVQFRMQIYNYIIANRARFPAMAFWMDDSQWVRFLHELVTPGRYKDVESEIVFMVVADMFGVQITVLMNDAPGANALSYCSKRLRATDMWTVVIVQHRLNNTRKTEHFAATQHASWFDCCSGAEGLPPLSEMSVGESPKRSLTCKAVATAVSPAIKHTKPSPSSFGIWHAAPSGFCYFPLR